MVKSETPYRQPRDAVSRTTIRRFVGTAMQDYFSQESVINIVKNSVFEVKVFNNYDDTIVIVGFGNSCNFVAASKKWVYYKGEWSV